MLNNLVLCSDKLIDTKAPWRLDDSLIGQLSHDHYIVSISQGQEDNFVKYGEKINNKIKKMLKDNSFENKVFIGYGKDCQLVASLYLQYGIKFDYAFFVNNPHPAKIYDTIFSFCAIYNIYTKPELSNRIIAGAECNQYIKTLLPAYMSKRVGLEIAGLLMYDAYKVDYFTENRSILIEV